MCVWTNQPAQAGCVIEQYLTPPPSLGKMSISPTWRCCVERCNWELQDRYINSSSPEQNGRYFVDISRCIFLNENCCALITISMKFVVKGPIHNKTTLVKIMTWRRIGDKPLSLTKADRIDWRIYAALGGDELTGIMKKKHLSRCPTYWLKNTTIIVFLCYASDLIY